VGQEDGAAFFEFITLLMVYLQQIKKKAKAEGKTCHAKKKKKKLIEFIMNQSESQR
jgi:hypothetical protein